MSSAVTCSAFEPFWPFELPFIAKLVATSHVKFTATSSTASVALSLYGNLIYNFKEEAFPETVKLFFRYGFS